MVTRIACGGVRDSSFEPLAPILIAEVERERSLRAFEVRPATGLGVSGLWAPRAFNFDRANKLSLPVSRICPPLGGSMDAAGRGWGAARRASQRQLLACHPSIGHTRIIGDKQLRARQLRRSVLPERPSLLVAGVKLFKSRASRFSLD